jgi:hypothetical protein
LNKIHEVGKRLIIRHAEYRHLGYLEVDKDQVIDFLPGKIHRCHRKAICQPWLQPGNLVFAPVQFPFGRVVDDVFPYVMQFVFK